jgi:hypothetical protein
VQRDTSSSLPLPVIGGSRALEPTPTTQPEGFAPRSSSGTLAAANTSQVSPLAHAGHGRALLAGLLVAVVTAALGAAVFLKLTTPAREPAVTPQGGPGATQRVQLRIEFGPEGATARLDGVPLTSSPFVALVDRDGTMHRIEVEAPGMAPKTTMVSYDRDVSVSIQLVAEASSASASAAAPPQTAPQGTRPAGRPADPKKPGKEPGEIDEVDPYKKK